MTLKACVFVAPITFSTFAAAGVETDAVKAAAASAEKWLALVDDGKYTQSWREAAAYFRGAVTEANWVTSLIGVRKPLGKVGSRKAGTNNAGSKLAPGRARRQVRRSPVQHLIPEQAVSSRDSDMRIGEGRQVEGCRLLHQVVQSRAKEELRSDWLR
jgi:Protein of unknown function (DUF4019)